MLDKEISKLISALQEKLRQNKKEPSKSLEQEIKFDEEEIIVLMQKKGKKEATELIKIIKEHI
jgi:hypothetical protein